METTRLHGKPGWVFADATPHTVTLNSSSTEECFYTSQTPLPRHLYIGFITNGGSACERKAHSQ